MPHLPRCLRLMMLNWLAAPGKADAAIRDLFAAGAITTIHAHNAAHGCFVAAVERYGEQG